MSETELTPYLSEFMKEAGILHAAVKREGGTGHAIRMPEALQTSQDRANHPIYPELKMAVICTLALGWLDKMYPKMAEEHSHEFRGMIACRLGFEVYRMLTDGVSIDVMRHITGEPDPHANGVKN